MASCPQNPTLPRALLARVLHRLGHWESSVERPHWSIPHQQIHLLDTGPTDFTEHHDKPEQLVRFAGSFAERQFWLTVLPNIEPNIRRIDRFQQCGAYAFVVQDLETGRYFLQGEACKLRICPVCRRRIQRRSSARVLDFMHAHPDLAWQFQTFTLKHSSASLPRQLDRLVRCFRNLRQRKQWRASVTTGYAVIEVTFHPAGSWAPNHRQRTEDEWHPHLHVIAATSFIDWGWLRSAWLEVTGDSDNIDCALVESPQHAAHYIAKYIGKPPNLDLTTNPTRAAEYYHALQARRMLLPFGATNKHKPPTPPRSAPSMLIARFSDLKTAASNGSYPAQCILAHVFLATVPRPKTNGSRHDPLFPETPP